MGKVDYEMTDKKKKSREFFRSLYITKDVKAGDLVTEENIRSVRPAFGLHPKYFNELLGKTFAEDLKKGTALDFSHILQ
jgi:pseudaminic acid synthase